MSEIKQSLLLTLLGGLNTRQCLAPYDIASPIRTSFLAGGREGEPARKLVLILKPLLFLLGKTSSLLLTYNATHLLLRLDNIETEPLVELDGRVVVNLNV